MHSSDSGICVALTFKFKGLQIWRALGHVDVLFYCLIFIDCIWIQQHFSTDWKCQFFCRFFILNHFYVLIINTVWPSEDGVKSRVQVRYVLTANMFFFLFSNKSLMLLAWMYKEIKNKQWCGKMVLSFPFMLELHHFFFIFLFLFLIYHRGNA